MSRMYNYTRKNNPEGNEVKLSIYYSSIRIQAESNVGDSSSDL